MRRSVQREKQKERNKENENGHRTVLLITYYRFRHCGTSMQAGQVVWSTAGCRRVPGVGTNDEACTVVF
jgi:hypothetical protein